MTDTAGISRELLARVTALEEQNSEIEARLEALDKKPTRTRPTRCAHTALDDSEYPPRCKACGRRIVREP